MPYDRQPDVPVSYIPVFITNNSQYYQSQRFLSEDPRQGLAWLNAIGAQNPQTSLQFESTQLLLSLSQDKTVIRHDLAIIETPLPVLLQQDRGHDDQTVILLGLLEAYITKLLDPRELTIRQEFHRTIYITQLPEQAFCIETPRQVLRRQSGIEKRRVPC